MRDDHADLEVCVDCLMIVANGDDSGIDDPEDLEAIDAGFDRWFDLGYHLVPNCDEDCDTGWFSWRACDICRRPLGGDRHKVAGLPFEREGA